MKKLTALLLVLIALLQFRLWFGDGNVQELHRLNDRIEELRLEGDKRRDRNATLEAEVMDLKQGTDAIEERARQDLGMIKEGETFVQVIENRQPKARLQAPNSSPEVEKKDPRGSTPKRRARRDQQSTPAISEPAPSLEAPMAPSKP